MVAETAQSRGDRASRGKEEGMGRDFSNCRSHSCSFHGTTEQMHRLCAREAGSRGERVRREGECVPVSLGVIFSRLSGPGVGSTPLIVCPPPPRRGEKE